VPKVLFTGRYVSTDLPHYDVTPDGKRFMMVEPVQDDVGARTIRVIDRWSDELRRRAPESR
jgi:hypothetical protein